MIWSCNIRFRWSDITNIRLTRASDDLLFYTKVYAIYCCPRPCGLCTWMKHRATKLTIDASSTTQQHNNVAAVVLTQWLPCSCENTSVKQLPSMRITLNTKIHCRTVTSAEVTICQTVWKQNMHTCYATRYQACRTALNTLYTTWHTAWHCRHTVDQTHDINQTAPIRDCHRDKTWEHRCATNMNQLIEDPLQHVACTPTSTDDDHDKQYDYAMSRANSKTLTPWMLNYIMSWLVSFIICTRHTN